MSVLTGVRLGPPQIVALFAVAGASITWLFTGPDDAMARLGAISAAAIALFAARVLPEILTAVLTFLAFLASGLVPNEVIFAGFATSGFWLLFAGLIIGTAISTTGLGRQMALRLFARTGTSYRRATLLLAVSGLALGLLVPSAIPRVVVLMPIATALAEAMGYKPGSRGYIGLTITAAVSTLIPTYMILTANLPTIVEAGLIEGLYGLTLSYGSYFVQQMPVNVVRMVVLVLVMLRFATDGITAGTDGIDAPAPLNAAQRRLLTLLGAAILMWATDFIHGIPPAWVALSVAAFLLWPAVGIMDGLAMKSSVDLSPAFFIAGVFCVSAVAQFSGLSTALADALIPLLGLGTGGSFGDLFAATGFSVLISHLTTAPATPVILAPLAASMADASGWSIETVAMVQVIGIATTLLPYQAPPLIVAMALAHIPTGPLTRVCLIMAAATMMIGLPLTWVWWRMLGLI